jgi:hypothetical protein
VTKLGGAKGMSSPMPCASKTSRMRYMHSQSMTRQVLRYASSSDSRRALQRTSSSVTLLDQDTSTGASTWLTRALPAASM